MSSAINDLVIRDIIIDEVLENYPTLTDHAEALADKLGPYLVESMWSAFDNELAQELKSREETE